LQLIFFFLASTHLFGSHYGEEKIIDIDNLIIQAHCVDCDSNKLESAMEVKNLIKQDINPHTNDPSNYDDVPAIYIAAIMGDFALLKFLSSHGVDTNKVLYKITECPLYYAAKYGHGELAKWLINKRTSVDYYSMNDYNEKHRTTPLITAAMYNHTNIIKVLINSNANIELQDNLSRTAAYWALIYHHNEALHQLITMGADVNKLLQSCTYILEDNAFIILALKADPTVLEYKNMYRALFWPHNKWPDHLSSQIIYDFVAARFRIIFAPIPQFNNLPTELINLIIHHLLLPWETL
jgi:ankyrin repeat protein